MMIKRKRCGIICKEKIKKKGEPCKMTPKKESPETQYELYKKELKAIINLNHKLVKLANSINWKFFEEEFEATYSEKGRPGISTRLMVGLHYLKYGCDLSDEEVLEQWVENPYWQYFCGMKFFEHKIPIDSSSLTRWRKRIGESGAEKMLEETLETGLRTKVIKKKELEKVNVDTTVQTKEIRFPTDARLYNRMREKLVKAAGEAGIELRQTYVRVGKKALFQQQNYARASQYNRAKRQTKKLKTYLGRVVRDIKRKTTQEDKNIKQLIKLSEKLLKQKRESKNKIYSIHEPKVECIARGKTTKKYEFGNKVGIITSAKSNWITGAKAFFSNPYDGHTLKDNIKQSEKITGIKIKQATCDKGYRGHNYDGKAEIIITDGRKKRISKAVKKWMKRRNAIEPIIGHQKAGHRLERNKLKGQLGDSINIIMSACGFNIKKLTRVFWALIQMWLKMIYNNNFQLTLN